MEYLSNILFYPIFEFEGFEFAFINILIFFGLFLIGKFLVIYLKRFFKEQDLKDKKFTVEGKEIPIWKLTKQVIWLLILVVGFNTLSVNNPHLEYLKLLEYEFFRFDKFHLAVYHFFIVGLLYFGGRITFSLIRLYLLRRIKRSNRLDQGTEYVYFQLIKYLVISVGIIMMLRSMGVDLHTFVQAMIPLSVAVALGLQEIFKEFFGGFLLLFEGTVKVGDVVEIDRPNGQENFVARILEINIRTSKVETRDGKTLIVPNSQLTHLQVNNWSTGNDANRFMIPVTVSYGSDLDVVQDCMIRAAVNHPKVLKTRDVLVRLRNFGDNGYELDLVFWAHQNFFIEIHKSEIRFAIDKAFKEHNISYPYPQMDVHMIKSQPGAANAEEDLPS
ncbi:mechanosensitive ion channel [Paracrocinitomix mangrovi]|uniref:mechanosensitive ion channel family protein n=1 Tax=Paracrocinitomix mangrovi TaxID=2862509 RepID=UPI001C8ECF73|nr:mechanosensitive ion channel domain-containing protein [Paracrocinitomix mangrovi]UKN00987.1 mechanosensitive ion channel [Paracrocinitomix mangrovi]